MNIFKVCPTCKAINSSMELECENCETDLQSVLVTDVEAIKQEETIAKSSSLPSNTPATIHICEDRGTSNLPNARKNLSGGEDNSAVSPTSISPVKNHYILTSLDGMYSFQLPVGKTTIGRGSAMAEYLEKKTLVNRRHAEIEANNKGITLQDLNSVNGTFVNNKRISSAIVELNTEDVISLGGNEKNGKREEKAAFFRLQIKKRI